MMLSPQDKYDALLRGLAQLESAAVAFSGGADSAFLLFAAKKALGRRAAGVTVHSVFCPIEETQQAASLAKKIGASHVILYADPLADKTIKANSANRCYHCKHLILDQISRFAQDSGFRHIIEGSNLDDMDDFRPGAKAVKERGVISPLKKCGFTKKEIRQLSRGFGLPTWNKPSSACLASRIPYGQALTPVNLAMAEEAERALHDLAFFNVRVRVHGTIARIEVPRDQLSALIEPAMAEQIIRRLKNFGFSYITADLAGYRTGSLNEALPNFQIDTGRNSQR